MSTYSKKMIGVAVFMGVVLSWMEQTKQDEEMVVVGIAAAAFILGLAHPTHAWAWAAILGGTMFLTHWVSGFIGVAPSYPIAANLVPTLRQGIPALMGAYLGVMVQGSLLTTEQPEERKKHA